MPTINDLSIEIMLNIYGYVGPKLLYTDKGLLKHIINLKTFYKKTL